MQFAKVDDLPMAVRRRLEDGEARVAFFRIVNERLALRQSLKDACTAAWEWLDGQRRWRKDPRTGHYVRA
jgi:hypothetical protein